MGAVFPYQMSGIHRFGQSTFQSWKIALFLGKFSSAVHRAFNHDPLILDPVHLSWPGWTRIVFKQYARAIFIWKQLHMNKYHMQKSWCLAGTNRYFRNKSEWLSFWLYHISLRKNNANFVRQKSFHWIFTYMPKMIPRDIYIYALGRILLCMFDSAVIVNMDNIKYNKRV